MVITALSGCNNSECQPSSRRSKHQGPWDAAHAVRIHVNSTIWSLNIEQHGIHIHKSLGNKRGYFVEKSNKWVLKSVWDRLFQKVVKVAWTHIVAGHSLQSDGTGLTLTLTLMARAIRLVGVTTGRCGQHKWSGQRPTNISELNTNTALVAVSSVPDQIGILAVTIKIISNFKCANKNIYCLQWPSGYWPLRPLWLHNLNNKSYLRWFFTSHAWSDNTVKWPRAEFC